MATEAIEAGAHAAGESGSAGMPQLDFSTFANQIFWLLLALVALWWVMSRIALPRIGSVLAERSGTITNDLAAAEELSLKVKEAEAAYTKALAEARVEANRIVGEARDAIKADLAEATARADAEIAEKTAESEKQIAAIRASAAGSISEVAKATATEIVAILGAEADAKTVEALVDARVKG
ncbi:F0F1 ATP synthase subunit B' [Frigidibacter sp. ROC022]|uniref:F0F1 ATP synthase subunit B' n=1 Tax=Frigidibacter sp. ROC022 TaxID=2971796 RepID=UPI00215B6ACC|nr:F0F1 ATP synthase subunit B' [Frigidibacter sp. ROC022]MCR8725985.1 F0F1 ATP synthase subunit B' [Frigidibacter sp. ROC022]